MKCFNKYLYITRNLIHATREYVIKLFEVNYFMLFFSPLYQIFSITGVLIFYFA